MKFQDEVLDFISIQEHSTCVIASEFGMGSKSMLRFLKSWKRKRLVKITRNGLWKTCTIQKKVK